MGRPLRPVADGLVYHAINRGNNRAAVFDDAEGYRLFLHSLRQTKERYPFKLFGYCLMTNHFHLVLQPEAGQSISRIVQSLTVAHTWWFHRHHGTVGHVWQGRFKSPLIETDEHLLTVVRYVESNPLRAGMVKDLKDYPWTSYAVHGLGRADDLVAEMPCWQGLRRSEAARQKYWRHWVHQPLTQRELERLRRSVQSGVPYGSPTWVERMSRSLGIALAPRPRGRPRKKAEI